MNMSADCTEDIKRKMRSHSISEDTLEMDDILHPVSMSTGLTRTRGRRTKSLYGANPHSNFGPKACLMKNHTTLTIQDPAGQKLKWDKPPLSVLIIKKIHDSSVIQPFKDLVKYLTKEKHMVIYIEAKVLEEEYLKTDNDFLKMKDKFCIFKEGKDDISDKVDLVVCLGGDGTLLYASSLFQQSVPPVLAFHLGSLGFLTPFQFDNFKETVTQVLEGNCGLTLRSRLKCTVFKEDVDISKLKTTSKNSILALNEVVVDRGPSPYICNIDVYIEKRLVTSVQGDGLIIATPTGSTAYAAAAGASMIHPNVPAITITPICPHSLSFRPIVVPAGVEIKIATSPDARNSAWVSFDGRNRQEIAVGSSVTITTSIYPMPSICFRDQINDWFEGLAECLHWNVRKQQRKLDLPSLSSTSSLDSLASEGGENSSR